MSLSAVEVKLDMSIQGLNPDVVTGLPLIMGTCKDGTVGVLQSVDTYGAFKSTLGSGPLVDAVVDHFAVYKGLTPYALAYSLPKQDNGTVGTAVVDKTGLAVAAFGTACEMNAEVYIECVKGGGDGVAKVNVSLDGGESWRMVNKTVVDVTDIGIPDAGLTCQFDFTAGDMDLGDSWTVKLSQPAVSLTEVMTAIQGVHALGYRPEYIVLCFPIDKTDAQSLHAYAVQRWAQNDPTLFAAQYADPTSRSSADIQTWVNGFTAEWDGWESVYNLIATLYARVAESSGEKRWRMSLGSLSGHTSTAQVNQSIGARRHFSMPHLTLPDAYLDAHANDLSNARATCLVNRPGKKIPVIDKGLTMAAENSIYRRWEVMRTAGKIVRLAFAAAEPWVEDEAWAASSKSGMAPADDVGVGGVVKSIKDNLDVMKYKLPSAEIDDYNVEVPEGQALHGPDGVLILIDAKLKPNMEKIRIGLTVGYALLETELLQAA